VHLADGKIDESPLRAGQAATQVERVRGSGKKQLPGPDRGRPDSYLPEQIDGYGACPRETLNLEPRTLNPE
jgi:hypothetical protein